MRLTGRFWLCWGAVTASSVGDGVTFVALPLLATTVTDDPRAISSLRIAALLPWLVVAIAAGVLVDRVNRRSAMISMEVFRAGLLCVVVAVTWQQMSSLWPLYVVVFLLGAAQTVFDSAAQAVVPEMVPDALLERAHGLVSSGQNVGLSFVGPPLGGLLFVVHPAVPFAVHASTFLVSAVLLLAVGGAVRAAHAERPAESYLAAARAGLVAVARDRVVAVLALLVAIVSLCLGLAYGIAVLYATETLGMSGFEFGVFISVGAIGGILAGLAAATIKGRIGTVRTLRLSICLVPPLLIAFGAAPWAWAAMLANLLLGAAAGVWVVVSVAMRQRLLAAELHGRVASIFRMLGLGMQGTGMIAGGYLAYLYGLRAPFLIGGVLALAPVWWLATRLRGERLADPTPSGVVSPEGT